MNKNFNIIVTHNALKKIFEISKISKINNFLLSAYSGGCNGFNYDFTPFYISNAEFCLKCKL